MKKIDEIFDYLNMQNETMNINEGLLTKKESDKIKELTFKKAGFRNKHSAKRRLTIPLVAIMTLVLSFAVVFAQGGFSNIYYKLFGENTKYVSDMGTVIDKSFSSNGITFNVSHMLGDENTFYIIFEIVKENGESFEKSDYIIFDTLRLDFRGSGGYSYYEIEDENSSDNKATFILYGNTERKTAGKNLEILITDITEYNIYEPEIQFDVYNFLLNNEELINQNSVVNTNRTPTPIYENITDEEKEKSEYSNNIIPKNVLPSNTLNIKLDDNDNSNYIESIGFVDGKLAMKFEFKDYENSSISDIFFIDKKNPEEKIYYEYIDVEEIDGFTYGYYTFDIKNMEDLKNYDLKYSIQNKINSIKGNWNVSFKADYKNTTKTINVFKNTEISGKRYFVKNIKLSPIALTSELINNIEDNLSNSSHMLDEAVKVVMKDGSHIKLGSWGASTSPLKSSINITFDKPIDTTQVDTIIIGDVSIEVN